MPQADVAGRDHHDARGQTVHVVEQVHGIGDRHDPEERHGDVQDLLMLMGEEADFVSRPDGKSSRDELRHDLARGLQVPQVVDGADHTQKRSSGEQRQ